MPRPAIIMGGLAAMIICLACGGASISDPGSRPDAPTTPPAGAPNGPAGDVSGIPFLSDNVSTADLTVAGWTCGANEIGNMDCSRSFAAPTAPEAEISLLINFDNRVSAINMSASGLASSEAVARDLTTQITRIATVHGWRCDLAPHGGTDTYCDKDGRGIAVSTYSGDGYAMASVRDPTLEGTMAD